MSRRQVLGIALVLAEVGCTAPAAEPLEPYQDDGKADGLASTLWLLDRHRLHVDEPSDLATTDGRLYTVSDQHSKIYEIDGDGDVIDRLDIRGRDLEALAIDGDGQFFVGDEATGKVWALDADGDRLEAIEFDDDDGNSGIEGLAFGADGHLFVAKEKDPPRIFELDHAHDVVRKHRVRFASDLSALAFNPGDGHLYALSDQDRTLFRLDADFDVMTAWRLPIAKPEGLAFDGATIYIASDSEERLYVLELE